MKSCSYDLVNILLYVFGEIEENTVSFPLPNRNRSCSFIYPTESYTDFRGA